jgi:UDP-N-acetylmuramoyl-L-alanyl-D-glutamate--2,6-diaminopimelate ligase
MEASSHALDQGRVDALRFKVAGFTNLTQDHLDHHGDMANYEAAKRRMFVDCEPAVSVVNVDNEAGLRFASAARSPRIIRVGRTQNCHVFPVDMALDKDGIRGTVSVDESLVHLRTRLVGEHNLENLMLALGILHALGADLQLAASAFSGDFGVPGRLERCDQPGDDIVVVVDYAHTPDALERVLSAMRRFAEGRVVCVFGCGGDRDPNKRPKMGYAVGHLADYAIVTNDNPRTEQPESIAAAIEPGLRQANARYEVLLDRVAAIERAIVGANAGDIVVIAGKGHEPYQIIGTVSRPFDDRLQARMALHARRSSGRLQSRGGAEP